MFKSLKGMPDLLPADSNRWLTMEERLRTILSSFGYGEIRTPILEETELFARSIGSSTDVVEKEMFTFQDQGGTSMTLRPENTAGVVRSYLEKNLAHGNPLLKVYYIGPMFRHERPQKGRFRQFSQIGIEAIGSSHPLVDVEVIQVLIAIGKAFGLPDLTLEINSVGDSKCRPEYRNKLQAYLRTKTEALCDNCNRRAETNPMRVFDCKSPHCQEVLAQAPKISDHLCGECKTHFSQVQKGLDDVGLSYNMVPTMVRGLDYYTKTAFELTAGGLGSQNAVGGGGRYDGLAEELGGPATPAIGFAMGLERLLLSASSFKAKASPRRITFIPLDTPSEELALKLSNDLREKVLAHESRATIDVLFGSTSLKSALRRADRDQTELAILLGEAERTKKIATVKDLLQRKQGEIPFSKLSTELLKRIEETP